MIITPWRVTKFDTIIKYEYRDKDWVQNNTNKNTQKVGKNKGHGKRDIA